MTVWVVLTEWNRGADLEGAVTLEGVYDNPVAARRERWACMRRYIRWGHDVYGRRNDADWDADVTVEERPVLSSATTRRDEAVEALRGSHCPYCDMRFDAAARACTAGCAKSKQHAGRIAEALAVMRDEDAFAEAVCGW